MKNYKNWKLVERKSNDGGYQGTKKTSIKMKHWRLSKILKIMI